MAHPTNTCAFSSAAASNEEHSAGEYVRGEVSTNGVENYWSCLKRTCIGTHHYMSDDHLHRCIEQHSFRYNRRDRHVSGRMACQLPTYTVITT